MSDSFRVEFGEPGAGWIMFRLEHAGTVFHDSFSHIYPTLELLSGALCDIAAGAPARKVTFLLGAPELELTLAPVEPDLADVRAELHRDHARNYGVRTNQVFRFRASRRHLLATFWRALRRLQTSLPAADFEREWREPFPTRAMDSLTKLVKNYPGPR